MSDRLLILKAVRDGAFTSAQISKATGIPMAGRLTVGLSRLTRSRDLVAVPYDCDCCGFTCMGYYHKEIVDEEAQAEAAEENAAVLTG